MSHLGPPPYRSRDASLRCRHGHRRRCGRSARRRGLLHRRGDALGGRGDRGEGVAARGSRRDPVRSERLRGLQHPPGLRAVREDPGVRRRRRSIRCCSGCSTGSWATISCRRPPASRSGRVRARRCCTTTPASIPLPRTFGDVVLNTMWALDDFTVENGATRIVPGSHRWEGRQPTAEDRVVDAVMPAGSVIFYGGKIFHGGGANQTDTPRLGVILEYVAAWLRAQETHLLAVPRVDRRGAARTPAGAARLQHLSAVPRLRRRAPPPPLHHRARLSAEPLALRVQPPQPLRQRRHHFQRERRRLVDEEQELALVDHGERTVLGGHRGQRAR